MKVDPVPDDSVNRYTIRTSRPIVGPIADALGAGDARCERLAEAIVRALDQDDGWTASTSAGWAWYPSRLAVELRCQSSSADPLLYVDTEVVAGASLTPELLVWLSDLNGQSAGWWWFDPAQATVHCSATCLAREVEWWWPNIVLGVLPSIATVTESMADVLAYASNGMVRVVAHPQRGVRGTPDGWIASTRMGSREPSASLDLWMSDLEIARLEAALDVIAGGGSCEVSWPLEVRVAAGDAPHIVLRRHWHPDIGWGWQLATLAGVSADTPEGDLQLRLSAASLNQAQAEDELAVNRFGGWTYERTGGLVHQTFIPAYEVEKLIRDAGESIGDITALMLDVGTRMRDLAEIDNLVATRTLPQTHTIAVADAVVGLPWLNLRTGPIGYQYLSGPATEVEDTWLAPRHLPICSFGIFNPMGPTVSSLEAAFEAPMEGETFWTLFEVMRHPFSPEINVLGSATTDEGLAELISDALARTDDAGVLGGGPEWMDIFSYDEAVLAGVRRFLAADVSRDWRWQADMLAAYAEDPWARVSHGDRPRTSPWPAEADPVECFLAAILHRQVIEGHQRYIRSAWEGVTAYRDSGWDPAQAQSVANAMTRIVSDRVNASVLHGAAVRSAE